MRRSLSRPLWLSWAAFVALAFANVTTSFAEIITIDKYTAEVRSLAWESRSYDFESRDLIGLDRNLKDSGLALQADVKELAKAMTELKADQTETEIKVDLSADVLFDFDKASIKPEADAALQRISVIIKKKRKGMVVIIGHTDAKGSDGYNQVLSQKRAESVRDWLMKNGNVAGEVIITMGMGESEPVAPNTMADGSDNPEGRKLNRRVGIVIQTK